MNFQTQAQVGQDIFAVVNLPGLPRTFLDLGVGYPFMRNNTAALEAMGWTGVLVDSDPGFCQMCRQERKSQVIESLGELVDWGALPKYFDYLSLDIDGTVFEVLRRMCDAGVRFGVATIEHDAYAYPDRVGPRDQMRELLFGLGYVLVCRDVCVLANEQDPGSEKWEFEDWWVDPKVVNMGVANRFNSVSRLGVEITSGLPTGPAV